MTSDQTALHVVMYHYVRDLAQTRYPRLKAMEAIDFRAQVAELAAAYEMCGLDAALDYLAGRYQPRRPLCLLTFDDGVKEHYYEVGAYLSDLNIPGIFFLITDCIENHRVAPVHMNHFLTASLDFAAYRSEFLERIGPAAARLETVEVAAARRTYIWDDETAAVFKYFFNFLVDAKARDRAVSEMFAAHLGSERDFARELYVSWDEARQMQDGGMILGGHTHRHRPCSALSTAELHADLGECRRLLDDYLKPQPLWPFSYPYGKSDSYTPATVDLLKRLGYHCSFATEPGSNQPGTDLFSIRRVDCKVATAGGRKAA